MAGKTSTKSMCTVSHKLMQRFPTETTTMVLVKRSLKRSATLIEIRTTSWSQPFAGITVSQILGVDPSVDSLAIDDYDHVEMVN